MEFSCEETSIESSIVGSPRSRTVDSSSRSRPAWANMRCTIAAQFLLELAPKAAVTLAGSRASTRTGYPSRRSCARRRPVAPITSTCHCSFIVPVLEWGPPLAAITRLMVIARIHTSGGCTSGRWGAGVSCPSRRPNPGEIMPYHHYVSAFHLTEFTLERRREGKLWVFDLARLRRWKSTAGRVGGEQRYNEVQSVQGVAPGEVEAFLSTEYEGPAAPILRFINNTRTVPVGPDLGTLLRYVALLSANNPSRRGAMNDSQEQALRFMAGQLAADDSG